MRPLHRWDIPTLPAGDPVGTGGVTRSREEHMQDVPRTEASSSPPPPADAQRLAMHDRAVEERLEAPGDACSRTRPLGVGQAVLEGCKGCGSREDSGILVGVASLPERPPHGGASAAADLRERFGGLFRSPKAHDRARSA